MQYENIATDRHLLGFCDTLAGAESICFDTEFVSEHSYRPQLCLVQVVAGSHLAIIDPQKLADITPFWQQLASGGHETIVHAGREEFLFCVRSVGRRLHRLLDIQLAAGLIGMEYPAAYGTLISRLLGKTLLKRETRTDWRRRPLSEQQLEYALQDAIYLQPLRDIVYERLERMGRLEWLETEMDAWQAEIESYDSRHRWRRVSGISGLSSRSLGIVRELWRWREAEAEHHNRPAKRVLRDDLIVELARRATAEVKRIRALRGLERRDLQRHLPKLASAIQRALELPDHQCPQPMSRRVSPQLSLLSQFLATALGNICRSADVAPSLVGTVHDVRDLDAYRLGEATDNAEPPALARGWRAEVVGQKIDDLLAGKLAIRVKDPLSDKPLAFEPTDLGNRGDP